MNSAAKEYSIFLSYVQADEPWVREFAAALQANGIQTFNPADLPTGQSFVDTLEAALRQSDTLIVFFSTNSLENPNVLFELGAAVGGNKVIIPVLVEDVDSIRLPGLLTGRPFVHAESPREAAKQVARIIEVGTQLTSKPE